MKLSKCNNKIENATHLFFLDKSVYVADAGSGFLIVCPPSGGDFEESTFTYNSLHPTIREIGR